MATSPRFQKAMAHVARWEGGLVNNPADPGGWTNYGISLRWLQDAGLDLDGDGTIDEDDVKKLTPGEAAGLYYAHFWRREYDQLASDDVAAYVFDMAVNMGADRAHRIAQQAAGVAIDGNIGPKTVAAMNVDDQLVLLAAMRSLREQFYQRLAQQKPALAVFLKGWLRRAEDSLA